MCIDERSYTHSGALEGENAFRGVQVLINKCLKVAFKLAISFHAFGQSTPVDYCN